MSSPVLNYQPLSGLPSGSVATTPLQGFFFYWPSIKSLTGGDTPSDLQSQDISVLVPDAMILVKIPNRGASMWLRTLDASTPATDLNKGVITPLNYDAVQRPYVLNREAGY